MGTYPHIGDNYHIFFLIYPPNHFLLQRIVSQRYLYSKITKLGMNDKVTYWMEMLDYDFDTANVVLETKRYLYVGFMYRNRER